MSSDENCGNSLPPIDGEVDETVVIPAYLGKFTIGDCLRSLRLAMVGRRAEIVLVESSQDGTADLVRREFPEVRVLALSRQVSAGEARNLGIQAARGQTLFFVDQDCVVPSDWLERLQHHLGEPGTGAAGGAIGFRNWSNLSGSAVFFLEFLYHFPSRRAATKNAHFLLGCNLACRREAIEGVCFPAQTLAEDLLFSAAIRRAGWDTVYDPTIHVSHWNREGWGEFFRYNAKMGRAAARSHLLLRPSWSSLVLRYPWLVCASPLVILPKIFLGLLGQWRYLARFLLLLPCCWLGNWVWAWAFYREIVSSRLQNRGPVQESADESRG